MTLDMYRQIPARFYDDQLESRNPVQRWFHAGRYKIINNLVKECYRPGGRIVDIGAGSCCWNTDHLPVWGIDCNETLLQYGQQRGRLTGYHVADIHDTGGADNSFDLAVATEVLEHIKDVDHVVQEVHRILKPGGTFVVSVPHDRMLTLWSLLFAAQTFYRGHCLGEEYYRQRCGHVQHFSPRSLRAVMERNGFLVGLNFSRLTCTLYVVATKGQPNPALLPEHEKILCHS